jgi:hypothetical protein
MAPTNVNDLDDPEELVALYERICDQITLAGLAPQYAVDLQPLLESLNAVTTRFEALTGHLLA